MKLRVWNGAFLSLSIILLQKMVKLSWVQGPLQIETPFINTDCITPLRLHKCSPIFFLGSFPQRSENEKRAIGQFHEKFSYTWLVGNEFEFKGTLLSCDGKGFFYWLSYLVTANLNSNVSRWRVEPKFLKPAQDMPFFGLAFPKVFLSV